MTSSDSIAIIGLSGRFPGAPDVDALWDVLEAGREAISHFAPDELELRSPDEASPAFVRAHGVLDGIDRFDAELFNIAAREARFMDPQQRLFLEHAWLALDDAGYDAERIAGAVSVYAGVNLNTYLLSRLGQIAVASQADIFQVLLANEKDHLATRVAYKLDLRGEAITVQTSCSTSLVAVHLACQSLLAGQSDVALAGAVSIRVPQKAGYLYQEGMIGSPDGHCRPYDARARGTVPGNGLGIVVLKRLDDALRDGDSIRAVIRGSAINNDGSNKVGYTAPSVGGQASVIAQALAIADVAPASIGMVEGHGTATPIGDPVEVEALTKVFADAPRGSIALGSIKSNLGHLDGAAGVAGLIKATLAVERGVIPPTVHFEQPNPALRLDQGPFYVNRTATPWPVAGTPRRCAVSSFGIGGTNVHLVVEQAPPAPAVPSAREYHLLPVAARTDAAVERTADAITRHLAARPELDVADAAYTLQAGRRRLARRSFAVVRQGQAPTFTVGAPLAGPPRVAFLFPGQGAHTVGMGKDLYRAERPFRDAIDECAAALRPWDLHAALATDDPSALAAPERALPALFAVELATARLWLARGVEPVAVLGHSFGEYVAACVAGVFTAADGVALALARGRLMQTLPRGAMLAVADTEARVRPYVESPVEVASVNAAAMVVLSGPVDAIAAALVRLRRDGIDARRVAVEHAFHSAAVDGLMAPLAERARTIAFAAPTTTLVSTMTGTAIDTVDATYLAQQMRRPVLFARGVATLLDAGVNVLVEMAPGRTLTSLLRKETRGRAVVAVASAPAPGGSEQAAMLSALGRVWSAGVPVDLAGMYDGEARRRVSLPGYAFDRTSYWIDAAPAVAEGASIPVPGPEAAAVGPEVDPAASPADRVAAIWRDLLGVAALGGDDDVYELGADSLLATQAVGRLRDAFAADLSLADVLGCRTPREIAAVIAAAQAAGAAIPVLPADVTRPLSYVQEWLWLAEQSAAASSAYSFSQAARARGPLSAAALAASIGDLVRRHETLRTSFPTRDGAPSVAIAAPRPPSVAIVDLSGLPAGARDAACDAVTIADARRPFDLATGPLFRTRLVRLAGDDHVVLFGLHHIVADAWSMGIVAGELGAGYRGAVAGEPIPLPEPSIQYGDFAAWQRDRVDRARLDELLAYWQGALGGAPTLRLPTDRPRPAARERGGHRTVFRLPEAVTAAVHAVARAEAATPYMVLLAGLVALLARRSGQDDFCIGMPVSGRARAETHGLIGCFINTVVLRARAGGNPSFRSLIGRVREDALAAYRHDEAPFERVVQAVRPPREAGVSPIFQVLFDFQNIPRAASLDLPGVDVSVAGVDDGTAKLDFLIDLWEQDGVLTGQAEYATDLFDEATIAGLLAQYEALLIDATARPDARLDELRLRGGDRRRLGDARATRVAVAGDAS